MEEAIRVFKSRNIPVLERGQPEYDRAIATANRLFRFSRPDVVVQPETPAHVQIIVNEARTRRLKVTIKCHGHSYAGHSTSFEGISLDLRRMKNVQLDMQSNPKTVTMDAGCQWGHVYRKLIDEKRDGFIANGGRCPTVGVSGFILGGGLSPFTRGFGMGSDTLVEATLVTANGALVTVKETDDRRSNNGRLFWALCGAGGGNFGVLVNMKLRVQQLRSQEVVAGRYQWFPEQGFTPDVIATMNDFYTTNWPTNITIDSTWICDLRQSGSLGGVRFIFSFDGNKSEYDAMIDTNIRNETLKVQFKRRVLAEKSTRFLYETLVNQWLEETERAYPTNRTYEIFSSFVFKNDRDTIQRITAVIRDLMVTFRRDFRGEQVNFLTTWIHSGGKATEKRPTDSAFFWREAVFHTYITVEWVDKWMERDMRAFLVRAKAALRPFSLRRRAAFMNFPDRDLPARSYERAYFGRNRAELRRVKQIWDRDNFFKFAQGIQLPRALDGHEEGDEDQEEDDDGREEDEEEDEDEDRTDQLAREQWEHCESKDLFNEFADLGF